MDRSIKNTWQVRLATVIIFLLGVAAGALAYKAYQSWAHTADCGTRGGRFERIFDRLQLNAEQRTQLQQILADARSQIRAARKESEPRMAEIRRQTDERMQQALTPEQWQQFQQMLSESHERRGRGRRGAASPCRDEH
jgi:Spy/CpxP family protein refolding chaperone